MGEISLNLLKDLNIIQKVQSPKENYENSSVEINQGLSPTKENNNAITYHICSIPNFELKASDLGLQDSIYSISIPKANRGDKNGIPHNCTQCGKFIEIGQPMIRLTETKIIEYKYGLDRGIRPIFKSWLFGNEECIRKWLEENNPEWRL